YARSGSRSSALVAARHYLSICTPWVDFSQHPIALLPGVPCDVHRPHLGARPLTWRVAPSDSRWATLQLDGQPSTSLGDASSGATRTLLGGRRDRRRCRPSTG